MKILLLLVMLFLTFQLLSQSGQPGPLSIAHEDWLIETPEIGSSINQNNPNIPRYEIQ
ncbi:MAG: hypothetical protein GY790_10875 [Bacteroidetes bacterium]|nr:hypothetical protein [Bacteroidota bacterium]